MVGLWMVLKNIFYFNSLPIPFIIFIQKFHFKILTKMKLHSVFKNHKTHRMNEFSFPGNQFKKQYKFPFRIMHKLFDNIFIYTILIFV